MTTREEVRWGVLGCARVATEKAIPGMQACHNAELVAIASRNLPTAQEAAHTLGIQRSYGSYDALLADPDIDAVYIPLPNSLHCEWTIKAARRAKHVLCEKPAALDKQQCQAMVDACSASGVLFAEGLMYRHHPQHNRVKELIGSGAIGDVRMMRASFSFLMAERHSRIRLQRSLGGGALMDVGVYCIDACRWILGQEPTHAFARAQMSPNGEVDVSFTGILGFPDGVTAMIDGGFTMARRNSYQVVGTEGVIDVPTAFAPTGDACISVKSDSEEGQEHLFGTVNQFRLEFEHFSDCILQHHAPRLCAHNSVRNLQVISALRQSLDESRPVSCTI